MSLKLRENQIFMAVPEGSHMARCVALIDLGMQYNPFYGNTLPKLMIGWELTTQLNLAGKPFLHFQRYTASLNPKSSLRALLEGWRGQSLTSEELEGFTLKGFLGKTCYLTIQQRLNLETKQRWAKIVAICPLPDVMTCPPAINQPIYFDCDDYNEKDYLAVPEGIRKHINLTQIVEKTLKSTDDIGHYRPLDSDEPQTDVGL